MLACTYHLAKPLHDIVAPQVVKQENRLVTRGIQRQPMRESKELDHSWSGPNLNRLFATMNELFKFAVELLLYRQELS